MSPIRAVMLALLFLTLGGCAYYRTAESGKSEIVLADAAARQAGTRLDQALDRPTDRVLLLRVGIGTGRVTLFGAQGTDQNDLGAAIDRLGPDPHGARNVQVADEGYPVAVRAFRLGNPFQGAFVDSLNLAHYVRSLHPTLVLVRVQDGVTVQTTGMRKVGEANGHSVYLVTVPAHATIVARAALPWRGTGRLLGVLTLPLAALALPPLVGLAMWKRFHRRRTYLAGASIGFALALCLLGWTLSVCDEGVVTAARTWLGEQNRLETYITQAGLGAFLAILIGLSWTVAKNVSEGPVWVSHAYVIRWLALGCLLGGVCSTLFVTAPTPLALMTPLYLTPVLAGTKGHQKLPNAALTARAQEFAERLNVLVASVLTVRGNGFSEVVNGRAFANGEIWISDYAARTLTGREMDFLLAREVTSLRHFPFRRFSVTFSQAWAQAAFGFVIAFGVYGLLEMIPSRLAVATMVLVIAILFLGAMGLERAAFVRKVRAEADTLRLIRDLEAGRSLIGKESDVPEESLADHAKTARRIAHLTRVAKAEGMI